jgi:ADP-heptose:LPS heptosyltransferase
MALPLLRALRLGRPDLEITLVAKRQFLPLLDSWGVADLLHALPPSGVRYFVDFWRQRVAYPDIYLLLTNSVRGDLEAWLTRTPQRFGLKRRGKFRPLLTHAYTPPRDFDERHHHQLELWENLLRHFGLGVALDRSPLLAPIDPRLVTVGSIGLIAGSENTPEKRWPVEHWRALIDAFPNERFALFGTSNDTPITNAIAAGHPPARVENLAGRTSLPTYAARLGACRLLITNDTGGMHLANALGVPLLALFGPTNPVRTGPIFSTPCKILQPPGCPATGGAALGDLAPAAVAAAVREMLTDPAA